MIWGRELELNSTAMKDEPLSPGLIWWESTAGHHGEGGQCGCGLSWPSAARLRGGPVLPQRLGDKVHPGLPDPPSPCRGAPRPLRETVPGPGNWEEADGSSPCQRCSKEKWRASSRKRSQEREARRLATGSSVRPRDYLRHLSQCACGFPGPAAQPPNPGPTPTPGALLSPPPRLPQPPTHTVFLF